MARCTPSAHVGTARVCPFTAEGFLDSRCADSKLAIRSAHISSIGKALGISKHEKSLTPCPFSRYLITEPKQ